MTQFRLRERCAHVQRVLPNIGALKAITARLVEEDSDGEEDPHLQLDEGLVDVASLRGNWDHTSSTKPTGASGGPRRAVGRWSWKGLNSGWRGRC